MKIFKQPFLGTNETFLAILLTFFITHFTSFIYGLPNSIQTETYSEPYQSFKMQFLVTTVKEFQRHIQNGAEHLRWRFLRKTFSAVHYFNCSLFTQKYVNRLLWMGFCNRLHLDAWLLHTFLLGSTYIADMFKER